MKLVMLTLVLAILMGCQHSLTQTSNKALTLKQKVEQEIRDAISAKDYRLYGFKGRRFTLPGVKPEQTEQAAKQCGYKFMFGTSDVIKSEQQGQQRLEKLKYATLYNQKMLLLCRK